MTDKLDLSPANEAALEASLARYHALVEERDQLKAGLATANEEIRSQRGINSVQQVSMTEMRDAHARELASREAENTNLRAKADEELARRVTVETLLRSVVDLLRSYPFASEPIQQPRQDIGEIGMASLARLADGGSKHRQ